MFKLGVANLRRLEDVPPIDIKPITVLVGRNSSGKSTFLRSLPLLRQSVTTRTSSPILWYGDWVDFGDFEGSVRDNLDEREISFSFGLDEVTSETMVYFGDGEYISRAEAQYGAVDLRVSISKHLSGTRITSLSLVERSNNVHYDLHVSENGKVSKILIDGTDMTKTLGDWDLTISVGSILPQAAVIPKKPRAEPAGPFRTAHTYRPSSLAIGALVKPKLDKRITDSTLSTLILPILTVVTVTKDALRAVSEQTQNRSWAKLLRDVAGADKEALFPQLRPLILLGAFPGLLNNTTRELRDIISSTLYIGPARARSDQYYRYQDLAVSEIDPDGKNFAMFLNSLTERQIERFSEWVKSLFGYGIKVSKGAGHISLKTPLICQTGPKTSAKSGWSCSI